MSDNNSSSENVVESKPRFGTPVENSRANAFDLIALVTVATGFLGIVALVQDNYFNFKQDLRLIIAVGLAPALVWFISFFVKSLNHALKDEDVIGEGVNPGTALAKAAIGLAASFVVFLGLHMTFFSREMFLVMIYVPALLASYYVIRGQIMNKTSFVIVSGCYFSMATFFGLINWTWWESFGLFVKQAASGG